MSLKLKTLLKDIFAGSGISDSPLVSLPLWDFEDFISLSSGVCHFWYAGSC
jgi:hypothetical protein